MNLAVETPAIVALALVFGTGILSGLSPCSLPTAVFVASWAGGTGKVSRRRTVTLSTAFVAGIVITLAVLGALAGWLGYVLLYVRALNYVVAAIMLLTALWLLKVIDFSSMIPVREWKEARGSGIAGAFLLGVPFALTASPCTFPVTIGVLAYVAARGQPAFGAALMLAFAVGRSAPLWVVATFAGLVSRLQRVAQYQPVIMKGAGVVLIGVAGWLLWTA